MRFPVEKIKAAMLHPDLEVREEAVFYFARSFSPDPTIMPLAIQAIEKYGPETFGTFLHLQSLVQTEATVTWLIQEVERNGPSSETFDVHYFMSLVCALRRADPALLKPHADAIEEMRELDDVSRAAIADRIYVSSFDPDTLWGEFTAFCEQQDLEGEAPEEQYEYGVSILDAMSGYPDHFAERVLAILGGETDEQGGWLEAMTIELAGKMKLEAAIAHLIRRLEVSGEWACEQAHEALVRIGSDAVVTKVAAGYSSGDWDFRLKAGKLLEDIYSDLSVKTALELLSEEQDPHLRSVLLQSILMNFSTDGIAPARHYILDTPRDPDVLEVRSALLVACQLMGETFPELEAWLKESNDEEELRQQWIKDHPFDLDGEDDFDDDLPGDDEYDQDSFDDDLPGHDEDDQDSFDDESGEFDREEVEPSVTIVRQTPHVGRNDPCPCGSGKKFKKCCYGKRVVAEPTDEERSAGMSTGMSADISIVRPSKSTTQFPIGTVALYGPDDKTTTKIVAGVITRQGAEPILERWVGSKVQDNPKVRRQIEAFFKRHRVTSVVVSEENMGCPHEEGPDFPMGEDCPFCPFWAGKQGSGRRG